MAECLVDEARPVPSDAVVVTERRTVGERGCGRGVPDLAVVAVGVVGAPYGNGYSLVASDGGTFAFGTTPFEGSLGSSPPAAPVAAVPVAPAAAEAESAGSKA